MNSSCSYLGGSSGNSWPLPLAYAPSFLLFCATFRLRYSPVFSIAPQHQALQIIAADASVKLGDNAITAVMMGV